MIKIYDLKNITAEEIIKKTESDNSAVEKIVADIIADVRARGDDALYEYTARFDGAITALKVTEEEITAAVNRVAPYFLETLRQAAKNITVYHEKQVKTGYEIADGGIVLGQKVTPLKRVGIYVPGGTARYPSTVLMNAIPAKIAGVEEIIMVSPPDKNGDIPDVILAAAYIGGVTKIFKVGGAQAVAALAYGTESIPAADKIVGPGNIYVATAKKAVFGQIAIDMIAGPSEILIIADDSANPEYLAADMLSQAEHDRNSSSVLVTDNRIIAERTVEELYRQLVNLPRKDIALASVENNGKIIIADSLTEAVEVSNAIAPEHLELCVKEPFTLLESVTNAGSVFLGNYTPEPLGDYFAGANHTLPTAGTARFSSPLSVDDFVKKSSYLFYGKDNLSAVADRVADFAAREGLTAHANAVKIRFPEKFGEKQ